MILALKLVLTPALIAVATVVGRRFGPSISGWLVGLPFTSGPVSLFLALEQGTPFAAAAAAGSVGGVAASALFAIAYAAMARRFGWPASLAVASIVFAAAVVVLRAMPSGSDLTALLALYAGGVAAALIGIRVIARPGALEEAPEPPRWDLPLRMTVATALVIAITSAAPVLGPQLSGLLTTYPIYAGVLAVFAHAQRGGAAATQVVRGLCYGIIAFATFFLTIGALVDRAGIVAAFAAATVGALLVQSVTLTKIRKGSPSPRA